MNSARKIQCGIGLVFLLLCMARVGAAQTTCSPTWNSTSVYTAGMKASLNGINYTANFWTQGQSPATNNGGPGSGQPWTLSLIHISEPTRLLSISYAVFC